MLTNESSGARRADRCRNDSQGGMRIFSFTAPCPPPPPATRSCLSFGFPFLPSDSFSSLALITDSRSAIGYLYSGQSLHLTLKSILLGKEEVGDQTSDQRTSAARSNKREAQPRSEKFLSLQKRFKGRETKEASAHNTREGRKG